MPNAQTRETLAADIWRACDILRRDNNCGGVMVLAIIVDLVAPQLGETVYDPAARSGGFLAQAFRGEL